MNLFLASFAKFKEIGRDRREEAEGQLTSGSQTAQLVPS